MIASKNYADASVKEYLEGELISPIKHEYRNGQIYAMAGASNPHVLICLNLATLLRNHLQSPTTNNHKINCIGNRFSFLTGDNPKPVTLRN